MKQQRPAQRPAQRSPHVASQRPSPRTPQRATRQEAASELPAGAKAGGFHSLNRALLNHLTRLISLAAGNGAPADKLLSEYFRDQHALGSHDRPFLADKFYAWQRQRRVIETITQSLTEDTLPRDVAIVTLAKTGVTARDLQSADGSALKKTEVALFEAAKGVRAESLPPAVQLNLPDWLYDKLQAQWGGGGYAQDGKRQNAATAGAATKDAATQDTETPDATSQEATPHNATTDPVRAFAQGVAHAAPLDLRVNALKSTREAAQAALTASGITCEPTSYAPLGLRAKGKPALNKHPLFLSGAIEVQDEGSQLLAHLVNPKRGELVVDFCAGAGGKTLALGALMRSTGRLYAFDTSASRLTKFTPRFKRSGLSNVYPQRIDSEHDGKLKRLAGKADRVLVDAPCSGLGTLRRNPDLKWRQSEKGVTELTAKQLSILASAAKLVRPGGRLVYATCSVLAEENEGVVAAFLAAHPLFVQADARAVLRDECKLPLPPSMAQLPETANPAKTPMEREDSGDTPSNRPVDGHLEAVPLRLLPHVDGTDGFFAAVLVRQAEA
jgi:16S rRNA (cytosine967-C5)-methyltransferase